MARPTSQDEPSHADTANPSTRNRQAMLFQLGIHRRPRFTHGYLHRLFSLPQLDTLNTPHIDSDSILHVRAPSERSVALSADGDADGSPQRIRTEHVD